MPTVSSDTKKKVMGDILKYVLNMDYCCVSAKVKNGTGGTLAAVSDAVGYPVKLNGSDWEMVQDTDEANATGVIVNDPEGNGIESLAAGASTAGEFAILRRGPAIIAQDEIASADSEASAYTQATLITALEALSPPIECRDYPSKTSQQTT